MLKHAILEGIKNLVRSFWLSVTAIFIILVSLTSVALVASLWVVTGVTLRQFDNQAVLYVYLKDGTTIDARETMIRDLKANNEVKEVRFIDQKEAERDLENDSITGASITKLREVGSKTNLNLNFVRESIKINPVSAESYNQVQAFVQQDKYVGITDEIQGSQNLIEKLQVIYYWTGVIGAGLVIVFGLISILVMINILRIAIYSRRDEIEIMRLVGATNAYIRGPFVAEGILYNLVASIFVTIIFVPTFLYLSPFLKDIIGFDINNQSSNLSNYLYLSLAITNFSGLVIGGVSSLLATQRYLKL